MQRKDQFRYGCLFTLAEFVSSCPKWLRSNVDDLELVHGIERRDKGVLLNNQRLIIELAQKYLAIWPDGILTAYDVANCVEIGRNVNDAIEALEDMDACDGDKEPVKANENAINVVWGEINELLNKTIEEMARDVEVSLCLPVAKERRRARRSFEASPEIQAQAKASVDAWKAKLDTPKRRELLKRAHKIMSLMELLFDHMEANNLHQTDVERCLEISGYEAAKFWALDHETLLKYEVAILELINNR